MDGSSAEVAGVSRIALDGSAGSSEEVGASARAEGEGTRAGEVDAGVLGSDGDPQQASAAAAILEGMPDEELLYDLADLFKVFSDTTRIKILFALMERESSVGDLAEAIDATQSAVSHQLRILKQSHLVRARRDGRNVMYSLADDHVYTVLSQGMSHVCE